MNLGLKILQWYMMDRILGILSLSSESDRCNAKKNEEKSGLFHVSSFYTLLRLFTARAFS